MNERRKVFQSVISALKMEQLQRIPRTFTTTAQTPQNYQASNYRLTKEWIDRENWEKRAMSILVDTPDHLHVKYDVLHYVGPGHSNWWESPVAQYDLKFSLRDLEVEVTATLLWSKESEFDSAVLRCREFVLGYYEKIGAMINDRLVRELYGEEGLRALVDRVKRGWLIITVFGLLFFNLAVILFSLERGVPVIELFYWLIINAAIIMGLGGVGGVFYLWWTWNYRKLLKTPS